MRDSRRVVRAIRQAVKQRYPSEPQQTVQPLDPERYRHGRALFSAICSDVADESGGVAAPWS
jgi:hypothetical protein